MLGPADALPHRPSRVLVTGSSGSGKTTTAGLVSRVLGVEHVEIDSLFHGPGWTERESFLDDVRALVARPTWVTEYQYASARALLDARADLVVWLDLPRSVVMRQVVVRTVRRRVRREVLWNGNVELPLRTVFTDPDHIVRWAWIGHSRVAPRVAALLVRRPDLPVVRLRSRRDVEAWLRGPLRAVAG